MKDFQLVFDMQPFRESLRRLLLQPDELAVGEIRTRSTPEGEELIITGFRRATDPPQSDQLSPFHCYAVMAISSRRWATSNELASIISPRFRQTLVAIVVRPDRNDEMEVTVVTEGTLHPPSRLYLLGNRSIRIDAATPYNDGKISSKRQRLRQSRTNGALSDELAEQINQLSLVVVGAGSGGSELTRQLSSLHPGRLTVIDHDTVAIENLSNLPHTSVRDLDKSKVDVLVRAIHRNQPKLDLVGIRQRIQDIPTIEHLSTMPRVGAVFSFIDNPAARLAAGMVARKLFVPHLDVGSLIQLNDFNEREIRWDIRLFEPGAGSGCVACVPKLNDIDSVLYALRSPSNAMTLGPPTDWNAQRAGSLLNVNAMAASLAIQLWIRYLRGKVSGHWIRAQSVDDGLPTFSESPVVGETNCPICRVKA